MEEQHNPRKSSINLNRDETKPSVPQVGGNPEFDGEKPIKLDDRTKLPNKTIGGRMGAFGWAVALPATLFFLLVIFTVVTGGVEAAGAGWIIWGGWPIILLLMAFWIHVFFGEYIDNVVRIYPRKHQELKWLYRWIIVLAAITGFGSFLWLLLVTGLMQKLLFIGGEFGIVAILIVAFVSAYILVIFVPSVIAAKVADHFVERRNEEVE